MGLVGDYLKAKGITKDHPDYNKERMRARYLLIPGFQEQETTRKRVAYQEDPIKQNHYRRAYYARRRQLERERDRKRRQLMGAEGRAKENRRAKERYAKNRARVRRVRNEWYRRNADVQRAKSSSRKDRIKPTRVITVAERELKQGIISVTEFVNRVESALVLFNERYGSKGPRHNS